MSFEATSPEPPLNYVGPTPNNLQNIVALPYEQVIPFLQPWPDATYYMTSGGVTLSAKHHLTFANSLSLFAHVNPSLASEIQNDPMKLGDSPERR